jgi:Fis family transcriptional regulator
LKKTINKSVQESVEEYLRMMSEESISGLYEMVQAEVEEPLLRAVLEFTNNNQSQSAQILGLNRGTLRKKLGKYNLL